MLKSLIASIIVVCAFVSVGFAEEVCGTWGYVYDHNGNKAGSTSFYTIHVERIDSTGSSGYYYRPFDSYYNVGCGQGLVAGDWWVYGETIENETHYYSNGNAYWDWYPHLSEGQHDLHCTRTTPPTKPDPQESK
jgi:hypothetical protein